MFLSVPYFLRCQRLNITLLFLVVLCAKVKTLKEENESCGKEKDAQLCKNLELKGDVERLENENKELTEERDECWTTNEELEAENQRLKKEIEQLKNPGKA